MREIDFAELNEHTPAGVVPGCSRPRSRAATWGSSRKRDCRPWRTPGRALVAAAHARGVAVVPLVGPSSIMLALMASGLEGQRFRFLGYLPADSASRRAAIATVELHSARHGETQIFIETPYRNDALLADLLAACRPATRLAVAAELTAPGEWIRMDRVEGWKARPSAAIGKRPAIFLLQA